MNIRFFRSPSDDTLNASHKNSQKYLDTNDEVFNKTNWTPLVGGGRSYQSHKLVRVNDDRIQFKTTVKVAIFFLFLSATGVFTIYLTLFGEGDSNPIVGLGLGLFMIVLGLFLFMRSTKRITFDRSLKALWKGKEDPAKMINPSGIDGYVSLKKLHAIQIIKELVESDSLHDEDGFSTQNDDFLSYELNLIMNDGKRINVLDHGHKQSIENQAYAISDLFDIPVWDACNIYDNEGVGLNDVHNY